MVPMRVAFVFPPGHVRGRSPEFREYYKDSGADLSDSPFYAGVGTSLLVPAALTPSSFEVEFIDDGLTPVSYDRPYDLVALTSITQQATRAYQIADEFRRRGTPVVMGGIHASVLPEEASRHVDSVVIGEAEYLWPELMEDFRRGCLKPFYRSSRTVDLKDSPLPRFDLLKDKGYPVHWVQTSRGCPRDCEFCAASRVFGSKLRHKTPDQVVREIRFLIDELKAFRVNFGDDNLFVDKKHYLPLLEGIASCRIHWRAVTDVSVAEDESLLKKLADSGCVALFLGLESVDDRGLINLDRGNWKLRQRPKYSDIIERIQSHGIEVQGSFIVGLDSDDPSVFDRLIEFISRGHLFSATISILTPLPGTRLRERLEKEGRLLDTPWENYTVYDINYVPKNMTARELAAGQLRVYRFITSAEYARERLAYFRQIQKSLMQARRT
jgi:radical SAM superfamily enzyme YgiQ (UPF0313 family)